MYYIMNIYIYMCMYNVYYFIIHIREKLKKTGRNLSKIQLITDQTRLKP